MREMTLIGSSAEFKCISNSRHRFGKAPCACRCSRPIHDCTHLVRFLLIFHLSLFLLFSTTKRPRADNTSAICNFLSYHIFSIRSSYITKPSVVSESGVKMVSNSSFVYGLVRRVISKLEVEEIQYIQCMG